MNKVTTSIDSKSGLMTVTKSAGVHPFLRAGSVSDGMAPKLDKPMAKSVWVMSAIRHVADPICCVPVTFSLDRRGGDLPLDNPELTAFWQKPARAKGGAMRHADFIRASVSWLKLAGEFFWVLDDTWLTKSAKKSPIILARPNQMREVCDKNTGELLGWRYRRGRGKEELLIPEQVKHVKNFNPYHDIRGLADWEAAQIAADADYAAGVFARNLMASNGDRGPIVSADGNPTDEQIEQITRQLREKSQLSRQGKMKPIFLAGPNIKVQDPTVQAVDAAFVAQRLENRHEVYIAFGVPASFAEVAVSYSIGAASDYFRLIESTCKPVAGQVADAIEEVSAMFLGTDETVFAEFDFSEHSTMQQVRAERFDQATKGVDRGIPWKVASDYLGLKMPRFAGDEIGRVPFNMTEVRDQESGGGSQAEEPEEEEEADHIDELKILFACRAHNGCGKSAEGAKGGEKGDDGTDSMREPDPERAKIWEAHVRARAPWLKRFESRFKRLLMAARKETLSNIESAKPNKSVTKNDALDLTFDLGAWLKEFLTGMSEVHRNALIQAGIELLDELDFDDPLESPAVAVQAALIRRENLLANTGTEIWNEVRQSISEGIDAGDTMKEIESRVKEAFNGISNRRARTIAVTETSAAYEAGRDMMMKEAGVEFKEWLTSQDERVRISHWDADGQRQSINEPFVLANGTKLMHPAETGGPPEETINCRCVSIAAAEL